MNSTRKVRIVNSPQSAELMQRIKQLFSTLCLPPTGVTLEWLEQAYLVKESLDTMKREFGTEAVTLIAQQAILLRGSALGAWLIIDCLAEVHTTVLLLQVELLALHHRCSGSGLNISPRVLQ